MTAAPPFLTRVRIRNYRSIAACDVKLGSLAFLVGPNGSGKSNFLDAIRFVADALDYSGLADNETALERALRTRGQLDEVLHAGLRMIPRSPSGSTSKRREASPGTTASRSAGTTGTVPILRKSCFSSNRKSVMPRTRKPGKGTGFGFSP